MIKPFWLTNTYRKELLIDAIKRLPKRAGFSLLKDLFTKRVNAGSHLLKYETIWELFHNKEIRTILDIGAYDGADAVILSRIFNKAIIYSFEADKKHYVKLLNNTKIRHNIEAINKAVSDFTGEIDFFASKNKNNSKGMDASGSILQPTEKNEKTWKNMVFEEPVKIPCISISEWMSTKNIITIDFVWMDVQGAELIILKGFKRHLKNVKGIIAEIWDDNSFYNGSVNFSDLTKFLNENNFRLSHLWKPGGSGDALFLNNSYL